MTMTYDLRLRAVSPPDCITHHLLSVDRVVAFFFLDSPEQIGVEFPSGTSRPVVIPSAKSTHILIFQPSCCVTAVPPQSRTFPKHGILHKFPEKLLWARGFRVHLVRPNVPSASVFRETWGPSHFYDLGVS